MSVTKTGNDQTFSIKSIFNAKIDALVKTVILQSQEDAFFEKGQLKNSSVFRKVNETIKVNKQTKRTQTGYLSFDEDAWHLLKISTIRYHLLSLLFIEPTDGMKVFSDNLESESTIAEITYHVYQIRLLNGSLNTYTFQEGKCMAIEFKNKYATLTLKRIFTDK